MEIIIIKKAIKYLIERYFKIYNVYDDIETINDIIFSCYYDEEEFSCAIKLSNTYPNPDPSEHEIFDEITYDEDYQKYDEQDTYRNELEEFVDWLLEKEKIDYLYTQLLRIEKLKRII